MFTTIMLFAIEKGFVLFLVIAIYLSVRDVFRIKALKEFFLAYEEMERLHGRVMGNELKEALELLKNGPREYDEGTIGIDELKSRLIKCQKLGSRFATIKPVLSSFCDWFFLTQRLSWLRR